MAFDPENWEKSNANWTNVGRIYLIECIRHYTIDINIVHYFIAHDSCEMFRTYQCNQI